MKLKILLSMAILFFRLSCMMVPYEHSKQVDLTPTGELSFNPYHMLSLLTLSTIISATVGLKENKDNGYTLFSAQGFIKQKVTRAVVASIWCLMVLPYCVNNECSIAAKSTIGSMTFGSFIPFFLATFYIYYTKPRILKKR